MLQDLHWTLDEFLGNVESPDLWEAISALPSEGVERGLEELGLIDTDLDRTKDSVLRQIAQLRRMRNQNSVVNRLPTEVLDRIFLELPERSTKDWTLLRNTASVCRRWYDIVAANPKFWKTLSAAEMEAIEMVLERNPRDSLQVWCLESDHDGDTDSIEAFMATAVKHVARWEAIFYQGFLSETIIEYLEKPTPTLTAFCIMADYVDQDESVRIQLSGGPSLQYLDIDYVYLPWDSTRLQALERIQISHLQNNLPTLLELHTFLLASSPKLQLISFQNWTDTASVYDTEDVDHLGIIVLPILSTLDLECIPQALIAFLMAHFEAPKCRSTNVGVISCNRITSPFLSIVFALLHPATANSEAVKITYGTGGRRFTIASDPIPDMDRSSWVENRKDPVGIFAAFDLEGCDQYVLEGIAAFISQAVRVERSTLLLEASAAVVDNPAGMPISPPALPLSMLSEYFFHLTDIVFGKFYDATPVLQYLGKAQLNGSMVMTWPCPRLTSIDLSQVLNAAIIAPSVTSFIKNRIEAVNPLDPGSPEPLKQLHVADDLRKICQASPTLRSCNIAVLP